VQAGAESVLIPNKGMQNRVKEPKSTGEVRLPDALHMEGNDRYDGLMHEVPVDNVSTAPMGVRVYHTHTT
jgi:hypothetical protein